MHDEIIHYNKIICVLHFDNLVCDQRCTFLVANFVQSAQSMAKCATLHDTLCEVL